MLVISLEFYGTMRNSVAFVVDVAALQFPGCRQVIGKGEICCLVTKLTSALSACAWRKPQTFWTLCKIQANEGIAKGVLFSE